MEVERIKRIETREKQRNLSTPKTKPKDKNSLAVPVVNLVIPIKMPDINEERSKDEERSVTKKDSEKSNNE